jgi:hypothetical protein
MKRNVAEETKVTKLTRSESTPKTLSELGMPAELAIRFEAAFRLMGATRGDQIVGFSFVDTDGNRHALRSEQTESPAIGRAA